MIFFLNFFVTAILHRTSVDIGQIKIQSVATCLFLCMDACGTVYGSPIFSEDCVFNESMEQHHFNTYSSTHHSNARRTLYLALNRHGEPRKIQIPPTRSLGKLATYTKSLTQTVEQARVETLITQNFGPNYIKHGLKQLCDSGQQLRPLTDKKLKPKAKCSLQNKIKKQVTKKKKRRKCRDDEPEGDNCVKTVVNSLGQTTGPGASMQKKRQQQAQKQNVNKCNHNEEDCVNNNLGNNSNNNNNNKKRPIMKKMQRAQSGGPGQKKGKQQQPQQHVIEIAAIHKLQPNNRNPGGKRNGKAKSTTTTTPKTPIVESLEELSAEEDDEFEDILIDPHGHNMQFVDDDDTLINEED
uniref:Fibroblast growth factor n=1 Tax=Culicoides sonorensis TaxID=179676 RepID=A0A336M9R4_CULSO